MHLVATTVLLINHSEVKQTYRYILYIVLYYRCHKSDLPSLQISFILWYDLPIIYCFCSFVATIHCYHPMANPVS